MRSNVRTTSSSVRTPSVLATSTCFQLSPYPADTWTISGPNDLAASFMRSSNSTLAALATESGSRSTVLGRWGADAVSATVRTPPPPRVGRSRPQRSRQRPGPTRRDRTCRRSRSSLRRRRECPPRDRVRSTPVRPCRRRDPADVERLSSAYTSAKSAPVLTAPASTRSRTSGAIIPPRAYGPPARHDAAADADVRGVGPIVYVGRWWR